MTAAETKQLKRCPRCGRPYQHQRPPAGLLGPDIRAIRRSRGLGQRAFGQALAYFFLAGERNERRRQVGISRSTVARWESGDQRPYPEALRAILGFDRTVAKVVDNC